jgi:pyrimidine deaminase RibD-like protein
VIVVLFMLEARVTDASKIPVPGRRGLLQNLPMNRAGSTTADAHMREALREGRRALPACLPNPPVGAVLVRGGAIVARGFTQAPGQPHAEAQVLAAVPGDLADAVLYVTLEPCSFHGRTPSCAAAIVERGLRVVHVALTDPDPRNDGRGLRMLREAGVEVHVGALRSEAARELGPYLALPANREIANREIE